ncbi:Phosphomevalonate kinase [bacterium HR30]|nr:Phosphomevalonate kinase [bacterium HR30]
METLQVRAPGKLFLLGEYAVPDGCPAIIAAVEPGVRVRAKRNPFGQGIDVKAPQLGICVRLGYSECTPDQNRGVVDFVAACISALSSEERLRLPPGVEFEIRFSQFLGPTQKLGLGGSAALVSAIVAALIEWCYGPGAAEELRELVYQRARAAHRLVQKGMGSGGDIAASVFGGVILFEPATSEQPVTPLEWPQGMCLLACYSGHAASTTALIEAYERAKRTKPAIHARFLQCSTQAVAALASALQASREVEGRWSQGAQVLPTFAEKLGLPYLTPNLKTLLAVAHGQGVTAKPSGAGGGDCAIAVCSETKKQQLLRAWDASGFLPLDLKPETQGVRCEQG